jgi:phosphohistidine swiveling domain-containing protein
LRPGTYDITTLRYDENPSYFLKSKKENTNSKILECRPVFNMNINEIVSDIYGISGEDLIRFMKLSLESREYGKFEFSRNLSDALQIIADFGEDYSLDREDLSFLTLSDLRDYTQSDVSLDILLGKWREMAAYRKEKHALERGIELSSLLVRKEDFFEVKHPSSLPNFVTQKKVTAPLISLERNSPQSLSGKIVLIRNADPGYDWIFTHDIAGLVTEYGGMASHMAIRCFELDIPAAIGCGSALYSRLVTCAELEIDAAEKRLERIS